MSFELEKSIGILQRTPDVLEVMLSGLSEEWTRVNEGGQSWSPYDIVGHLLHGERTDWIARMEIILSDMPDKRFAPFDRFAQFDESKGKSLEKLLAEFKEERKKSIRTLLSKKIDEQMLSLEGIHPKFGRVTLRQLLSTWVTHDLAHVAQIARVMAKQYKEEVGPWIEFLPILTSK